MNSFVVKCYDEIDFRFVKETLIKLGYFYYEYQKNYRYSEYVMFNTELEVFICINYIPKTAKEIEFNDFVIMIGKEKR